MNPEKMSINEQDINTVREPEKMFGPNGTLKMPIESVEEASGVHERASLPEIYTPPREHAVPNEPKVVINDEDKLVELRGGLVAVKPLHVEKFNLAQIEADLKRVDKEIAQAQKLASRSSDSEERGLGFKRLAELKRDKDKLTAQLPFARKDEFDAVDNDFNNKADRYHFLLMKGDKQPAEANELDKLTKELPILKAHRDQLKQSIDYYKHKNLSTMPEPKNIRQRINSFFQRFLRK